MKQRLLTVAAAVTAAVAAVIWALQGAGPAEPAAVQPSPWTTPIPTPSSQPPASEASVSASDDVGARLYTYAIPIVELHGLSPDAAPGSRLDVWVTWQPPGMDQPDVRPLLEGVILERIAPPLLPEGPQAAVLQVPIRGVRRLVWGHRFGSLSVLEPIRAAT